MACSVNCFQRALMCEMLNFVMYLDWLAQIWKTEYRNLIDILLNLYSVVLPVGHVLGCSFNIHTWCKDFDPNKTVRDAPLIFIFIILTHSHTFIYIVPKNRQGLDIVNWSLQVSKVY